MPINQGTFDLCRILEKGNHFTTLHVLCCILNVTSTHSIFTCLVSINGLLAGQLRKEYWNITELASVRPRCEQFLSFFFLSNFIG